MARQIGHACLLAVLLLFCACNPPAREVEDTYPVSGTVTLDGEPLAEGKIHFITRETGALDIADIQGGKFEGQAKAGNRRVEVVAYREGEPMAPFEGADPEPTLESYIPARYNSQSTLTAEVTEQGPNQFEFSLTSGEEAAPQ